MRTSDVYLTGIGVHLPATVSVTWAVQNGRYPADHVDLHELTGAAVAGSLPAPEMGLLAAEEACDRSGQDPKNVDLLLYADSWHQGPDGWQPQYYLQHHLTGGGPLAIEVRQGCNGMFGALQLAAAYLQGVRSPDRARTALLVAADNFGTPLIDRWRMGDGYIAGDGASALVLSTERGFARVAAVGAVAVAEAEEMHRGDEPLFPPGPTVCRTLDFPARNTEFKRGSINGGAGTGALLRIHGQTLALVERTLADAGIGMSAVTRVAYMNYSREIVEQRCMVPLGLPMSRSVWDFGRTVGHLGASDQVVALNHLLCTGQLVPGDHVLMLGVGPGVTLSCAVIEILWMPPWGG
ncbi:ketoacyl-ACP synthase III family protein [Actinoplanes auranticolor]|uniref:3-oxoacyl-[acyl-carrier-protein] synthase-3 n=1 Tax=Actinoplanes auranticolor TaxID=47988 RepID=A0A919SV77_9ACTN|nr:ketoacyl-ACP synthase III family protein [Actinoplanes auranticolor]GIM79102.1 hypothetical protein Aau02nite_84120 [Actinoplanes auranticolor]